MTSDHKFNEGGRYVIPKGGKPADAQRVRPTDKDGNPNPAHHGYSRPIRKPVAETPAAPETPAGTDTTPAADKSIGQKPAK